MIWMRLDHLTWKLPTNDNPFSFWSSFAEVSGTIHTISTKYFVDIRYQLAVVFTSVNCIGWTRGCHHTRQKRYVLCAFTVTLCPCFVLWDFGCSVTAIQKNWWITEHVCDNSLGTIRRKRWRFASNLLLLVYELRNTPDGWRVWNRDCIDTVWAVYSCVPYLCLH